MKAHPLKPAADEFTARDWPLIRFVAVAAIVLAVAVVVRVMA
jgi:hypothetical protein